MSAYMNTCVMLYNGHSDAPLQTFIGPQNYSILPEYSTVVAECWLEWELHNCQLCETGISCSKSHSGYQCSYLDHMQT